MTAITINRVTKLKALRHARHLLKKQGGWIQHEMKKATGGGYGYCLLGVTQQTGDDLAPKDEARAFVIERTLDDLIEDYINEHYPRTKDHELACMAGVIAAWNDMPSRKKAHVIRLFDGIINELEADKQRGTPE